MKFMINIINEYRKNSLNCTTVNSTIILNIKNCNIRSE